MAVSPMTLMWSERLARAESPRHCRGTINYLVAAGDTSILHFAL